jgi:hypothetical protein
MRAGAIGWQAVLQAVYAREGCELVVVPNTPKTHQITVLLRLTVILLAQQVFLIVCKED